MAFFDFSKPVCHSPFEATYLPSLDAKFRGEVQLGRASSRLSLPHLTAVAVAWTYGLGSTGVGPAAPQAVVFWA